jgi:hypothetical protein
MPFGPNLTISAHSQTLNAIHGRNVSRKTIANTRELRLGGPLRSISGAGAGPGEALCSETVVALIPYR